MVSCLFKSKAIFYSVGQKSELKYPIMAFFAFLFCYTSLKENMLLKPHILKSQHCA